MHALVQLNATMELKFCIRKFIVELSADEYKTFAFSPVSLRIAY